MHLTVKTNSSVGKALLLALLSLLFAREAFSQTPYTPPEGKKGSLYLYWGYNRSWYSRSNLHFTGPAYDFTVYDVTAQDRPTPFGAVYFKPSTFTIPQYVYRLGYHVTDRFAISGGLDHMKYVMDPGQATTLSGVITEEASPTYQGAYLHHPISLTDDFLQFEHTDGLNLVSLEFEYLMPLFRVLRGQVSAYWNVGTGGIWMVTKTNVKVLGDGLDNDFHVAGYTLAGKTGPRIEFRDRYFVLSEIKGGYASLPAVLIKNSEPEIGDHNFNYLEWYLAAGVNIRIRRKKTEDLSPLGTF